MGWCKGSKPKRRTPRGRGKTKGYRRGMRGHSWKKIIRDGIRIGRECTKCGKKHIIPELSE